MSGLLGIINDDDAPVDRTLLRRMTDFMTFRGPDGQDLWIDGAVGLGHTKFSTGERSRQEQQPFSLDGRIWIVADARIDGQGELIPQLQRRGLASAVHPDSAELILRAYAAWGDDCLQHLIGDFAFAIWDGPRKRLLCGRDHFGVKPFYYSAFAKGLIVSNTLNCIRLHPAVSAELNEEAIGDFLLFGFNQDNATTAFRDIRRLPPAHYLIWSDGQTRLRRYWSLPADGRIRYKRPGDYVDRCKELLDAAVADRLRSNRAAVFMSGGLDSTMIAATAKRVCVNRSDAVDVRAFTVVCDQLVPDAERHFSGLAAEALGIPVQYLAVDNYKPYERFDRCDCQPPEPSDEPFAALWTDHLSQAANHSPVVLTGYGPDAMLAYPMRAHLIARLRELRLDRVVADLVRYSLAHGRSIPRAVVSSWRYQRMGRVQQPGYPPWIEPAFAARTELRDRWERARQVPPAVHSNRQCAYQGLSSPFWSQTFERCDAGVSGVLIDARHPFFDLRLVDFLLAIPSIPWCLNKRLIREAARGMLPESVRCRPKAALPASIVDRAWRRNGVGWGREVTLAPALGTYVVLKKLPAVTEHENSTTSALTRPLSLNFWLRHSAQLGAL